MAQYQAVKIQQHETKMDDNGLVNAKYEMKQQEVKDRTVEGALTGRVATISRNCIAKYSYAVSAVHLHQTNGQTYKPKYPLLPAKHEDSYGNITFGRLCGLIGFIRLFEFASFCAVINAYFGWLFEDFMQYEITWIALIIIVLWWFFLYTHLLFYVMFCNHCVNSKLFWYWSFPVSNETIKSFDHDNEVVTWTVKEFTFKRTEFGYADQNTSGLLQKDEVLEDDLASVKVMIYSKKWYRNHVCQSVCWVIIHWIWWLWACFSVFVAFIALNEASEFHFK